MSLDSYPVKKKGLSFCSVICPLELDESQPYITTNLSFDKWSEIFGDTVITASMVDRLTHKAYVINMNGKSYRVKETKKWLSN